MLNYVQEKSQMVKKMKCVKNETNMWNHLILNFEIIKNVTNMNTLFEVWELASTYNVMYLQHIYKDRIVIHILEDYGFSTFMNNISQIFVHMMHWEMVNDIL
jgi:hypothetical protein